MDTTNEKQRAKNLTSLNIIALLIAILPFQLTWITYAAGIYFPFSWLLQLLEAFATGMVIVYAYHREWMYVIIYGVSSTVGRILLCLVQLSMEYYRAGCGSCSCRRPVSGGRVSSGKFLQNFYYDRIFHSSFIANTVDFHIQNTVFLQIFHRNYKLFPFSGYVDNTGCCSDVS